MMILAPASPSASEHASPIPCPPPVTTATRPPSLNFSRYIFLFILFATRPGAFGGQPKRLPLSAQPLLSSCRRASGRDSRRVAPASARDGISLLVEAVQAGRIRRQPHAVTGFQIEFADVAACEHSELTRIDIEESIAAKVLGDRHRSGPA